MFTARGFFGPRGRWRTPPGHNGQAQGFAFANSWGLFNVSITKDQTFAVYPVTNKMTQK